MDRSAMARALAKAQAHEKAGNHDLACGWAAHLMHLLDCEGVLNVAWSGQANTEPGRAQCEGAS